MKFPNIRSSFLVFIPAIGIACYFMFFVVDWFSNLEVINEPLEHKIFQMEIKKDFTHFESLSFKGIEVSIYTPKMKNRNGLIIFQLANDFQVNFESISIEKHVFSKPAGRVYRGSFSLNQNLHFSFPDKMVTQKIEVITGKDPIEDISLSDDNSHFKMVLACDSDFSIKLEKESAPFIYYDNGDLRSCTKSIIEIYSYKGNKYLLVTQTK